MKIIDFRLRFRTSHMLVPWNPKNPAPHFEQYIKFYKMEPRLTEMSMSEFTDNMHNHGVSKGVVCGGSIEDNNHLMEIKEMPIGANYYYITGIHPKYGIEKNLKELEQCQKAGFLGVNISPYIWGIPANAKELYPVYAYCEMNNLVAIVHGSLHYNRYQSMWLGDPQYMDEIAISFPKLKLVISHAGNGFGVLGLTVAHRHPNVFLEFSALWPKYLPDITINAVNTYLKDKCLFGTDYPLVEYKEGIKDWSEALRENVRELFFEKNAIRCLFGESI